MNLKIIFICIIFPFSSIAQQKIDVKNSCSYYGEKLPLEVYGFTSDNEAQTALTRITNASGLSANFKLMAGNVPNACAVIRYDSVSGAFERYIIYNQTFIQTINSSTNDWALLSILAHEVGHHLSGHSLLPGGSRPALELEADKFSGFILQKLGATLEQAQSAINAIAIEDGSSTHPPKSARLAAVANGWTDAYEKVSKANVSNENSTNIEIPIGSIIKYEVVSSAYISSVGYKFNEEGIVKQKNEIFYDYINYHKKINRWSYSFATTINNPQLFFQAVTIIIESKKTKTVPITKTIGRIYINGKLVKEDQQENTGNGGVLLFYSAKLKN